MNLSIRVLLCFSLASILLAQTERWWEREPLRLVDLVTGMDGIDFRPAPEVAARKAALGYNSEHFDVMKFVPGGMDDTGFFFRSPLAAHQNPDYLGQYLPEAHRHGIRVMIYLNVHWFTKEFGRRRPDWLQIRENGKPLDDIYSTGSSFCLNSPWREWVFQVLRDLLRYPIDGIFYDGPAFFPETCYCHHCREKFQRLYGRAMPSKRSIRGQEFHDLVEFQTRSIVDFLAESRRIIKAKSPDLAFYMNGGVRGSNWATGRLNRVITEQQDILGSEGGFIYGDLTQLPMWKPGLTARLLETQAPHKPRVIFNAAAHKPWTYSVLPAPEQRLLYADTIANGASTWYCMTPFELNEPEMDAIADMNRFVGENAAYYMHTRSEARAAIVWSDTTANSYAGSDAQLIDVDLVKRRSAVGDLSAEFSGLSDALIRAHLPFDVIDDTTLEKEPLDKYAAIFLPNVASMSDAAAARLKQYVRGGGNLFSTFETSMYDQYGIRRPNFALAEVFGAASQNRIAGPRRWDAMQPSASASGHPLLEGLHRRLLISPTYYLSVKPSTAQSLVAFIQTMAGRYDGLPGLSGDPALLVNRYGKGASVYSPGDWGASLNAYHFADFYKLMENAVRLLAPPSVTLENAPGSLEIVLRSQAQGRLLVHLVNFTGEMTRPIRRILPIDNLGVTLRGYGPFGGAHTLIGKQHLLLRTDGDGAVSFHVPHLDEYEVVVLEK